MLIALVLATTAITPHKWTPHWYFTGSGNYKVSGEPGKYANSYVGKIKLISSPKDLVVTTLLYDGTYAQMTMYESPVLHPMSNCAPTVPNLGVANDDDTVTEALFDTGCVVVVDNYVPPKSFLKEFHLPRPKTKTRGLSKFRVRRDRGAQNTTFAGYGTTYTVCYYPTALASALDNDCFDVYVSDGEVRINAPNMQTAPVFAGQGVYVSSDGTTAHPLVPSTYDDGGVRCK